MGRKQMKREDYGFFLALLAFLVFCWFRYFERSMEFYNTTLFALSYRYGFISRGLAGTFWEILDRLLPFSLMSYRAVYVFHIGVTIIFEAVMYLFCVRCYLGTDKKQRKMMCCLISFLVIFAFPMFLSEEMFGRLDVYLYILVMIGVLCLMKEKQEWLVIPIALVCICIHQGFVFMNANILLVLLLYKAIARPEKCRKYLVLFTVFFIIAAGFFCYFEFFSHANGTEIADEIITNAKLLSEDGNSYNETIVRHEILGEDVFQDELKYHMYNYRDFPVFLVLFSPYLAIGLYFFRNLIRNSRGRDIWKYLIVFAGAAAVLPQMVLKVDYGRYMFFTLFYYITVIMVMLVMGDEPVLIQLENVKAAVKKRTSVPLVLLVYPIFLTPFYDVIISGPVHFLSEEIFNFMGGFLP